MAVGPAASRQRENGGDSHNRLLALTNAHHNVFLQRWQLIDTRTNSVFSAGTLPGTTTADRRLAQVMAFLERKTL